MEFMKHDCKHETKPIGIGICEYCLLSEIKSNASIEISIYYACYKKCCIAKQEKLYQYGWQNY